MSAHSLTAIYSYDGMGNRDVQTAPGNNPTEMYYDARGQLISQGIYIPGELEVHSNYVWSAGNGYQNALVLRDDNYGIYNTQYMNFNDREYAQYDATYSITSLTGYQAITGDGNADGVVDNADFVLISNHFGLTIPGGAAVGDFNGDGTVDDADLAIFDANTHHTGTGTWVISDRFDYTPFGVMTTLSTNNFTSSADIYAWNIGFQGMVYDTGTKLNFTLTRVYEAETGRFLTVDQSGLSAGMDDFIFTLDNPINGLDPTGLDIVRNGLYDAKNETPQQILCKLHAKGYKLSIDEFMTRLNMIYPTLKTDTAVNGLVYWAVMKNGVYTVWDGAEYLPIPILQSHPIIFPAPAPATPAPLPPPPAPVHTGLWPHGAGPVIGGTAEAGALYGGGANLSAGSGLFMGGPSGVNTGAYASGGLVVGRPGLSTGLPGGTTQTPVVGGLTAGVGAGAFFTNATSAPELAGHFWQWNLNLPGPSFSFSLGQNAAGDPIWVVTVMGGKSVGASGSGYETNTFWTSK